ncbi:uncharacterized protein [Nicotiana sylvestris]|uniref:uncharacterized protein n=1 Tax=Nicotiana sylvestris TaxID=4096 RepID=UPI00388C991E
MARHRKKLPSLSEAKEYEGKEETPTHNQPSRWLTGMGSAPTVFHKPAKDGEIDRTTVTPDTCIQQGLLPVTFGSFLPQKFQQIREEIEENEAQTLLKETTEAAQVYRRLQFSAQVNSGQIRQDMTCPVEVERKKEAMQKNRSSQKGKTLCYVPPAMRDGTFVVQIEDEDTKEHETYWSTALIGFVLGDNPYEKAMDNYDTNVWNFVEKPQILYHEDGYYIFRFENTEYRDLVLQAGPYTYHNKPFVLQQWRMDFKFDPGSVSVIPLWITFPGLPLGFWSIEALSKLDSVVGKPLYTDKITTEMEKVSYARVLVETDISQPLPDSFKMQTKRGVIIQQIEYEWKPKYCCDCIRFGHNSNECWLKEVQEKAVEVKVQQKDAGKKKQQHRGTLKWMPKDKKKNDVIQHTRNEGDMQQTNDKGDDKLTDNGKMKGKSIEDDPGDTGAFSLPKNDPMHLEYKGFCCNYKEHPNGRIWLLWKQNVEVQILLLDELFIHCEVQERSSTFKTLITVVYASNKVNKRQQLWVKLVNLGATIKESWLLSGDFNNVLHIDDRIGAPVTQSIVEKVWNQEVNGGNMHRVWNKLKDLKTELKELNTYMTSYRLQLNKARLIDQEKMALMEVEKWSNIEEQILHQKSRAHWIACGDSNSKYFHAQLKLRTNTNTINSIYTDLGDKVSDPILVEEEFVKFFRKLLGENNTTCECPNSEVIRQGPCLNMQQKEDLIKVVTRDEILQAIKDMPHDKAPGVDGFPIEFLTRHWQVVGDDIYEVVKDFFVTGRLHKGVSSTAVTLIPKVQNPSQVKDYRPIACCTILYKIIAKVLTTRLKPVIGGLIERSQSAFIEGRSITDNILFTHESFKGYNRKGISPRCVLKVDLRKAYDTVE